MGIAIRQLHPVFAAEVTGVDLREPVPPALFARIEAAFDEHAVLVFHDQDLTDEQQIAFSSLFGPLENTRGVMRTGVQPRLGTQMADVSNLDSNQQPLKLTDRRRMFNLGNQLWHTDSSFKRLPAKCSLLSARAVPPAGGETEFADLRAAYDALPDATKQKIDGLVVEHWIGHSRSLLGFTDFSEEERAALPPVPQTLVRVHPGSRRKTLYLASHASHVIDWPEDEGRRLLDRLIEHATQRQFVYRHRWRPGDLVLWDNRCTMHRGRPYDERHKRDMRRTTVSDVAPTLDQRRAWVA